MEKTSIIVLVRKRQKHLHNLLIGIQRLGHSNGFSLETVVVHMNEPTQSPPDFFTGQYLTTTSLSSATELPLAQARNRGAEIATGDRLIFLDVDCIPAHHFVADYDEAFNTAPTAIFMGTVFYLLAPVPSQWHESDLIRQGQPHPLRQYLNAGIFQFTSDYYLFWSLNFGLRRAVWDTLGGFDEQFQGYGAEDTDFAFTAKEQGIDLAWLKGGTAFHQYHAQYSPPLQHFHDIIGNATVFYRKWQHWPMEKWLHQFAEANYIDWSPIADEIRIHAAPTVQDLTAARQNS